MCDLTLSRQPSRGCLQLAGIKSTKLDKKKETTRKKISYKEYIPTYNSDYTIYSSIKAACELKKNNLQPDATGMCFTKALNYIEQNEEATMHERNDNHIIVVKMIDEQTCLVSSFGKTESKIELKKDQLLVKRHLPGKDQYFLWQGETIRQYEVNNGEISNDQEINLNKKLSKNDLINRAKSYFEKQKKAIYVRTYQYIKLFVKFDFENLNERITINIKCGNKLPEMITYYSDQEINNQGLIRLFTKLNQYIKIVGLHEDRELLNQLHFACQIYNIYDDVG